MAAAVVVEDDGAAADSDFDDAAVAGVGGASGGGGTAAGGGGGGGGAAGVHASRFAAAAGAAAAPARPPHIAAARNVDTPVLPQSYSNTSAAATAATAAAAAARRALTAELGVLLFDAHPDVGGTALGASGTAKGRAAAAAAAASSAPAQVISNGGWIVSREFDLLMFLSPLVLGAAAVAAVVWDDAGEKGLGELLTTSGVMPLWAFLAIVVAFDVAHVWASTFRVYTDRDEWRRRFWLYTLPLPVSFVGAFVTHYHAPVLFWTLLAYVAVWHFVKQPFGFIALYKARHGEHDVWDFRLDKWTTWCGGLGPVLMWHGNPKRMFDWFNATESFLFRLPSWMAPLVKLAYVATAIAYVARQVYIYRTTGRFNKGKNLVMAECWLTWQLGVACNNTVISAACLNLFHGVPFFMLTWIYCRNKYGEDPMAGAARRNRFMAFISHPSHYGWFFLAAFVPALVEEALWDFTVWQQYIPGTDSFDPASLATARVSFWVALLSVPQIVHYFLDNFLWKFDGHSNPDLRQHLRL